MESRARRPGRLVLMPSALLRLPDWWRAAAALIAGEIRRLNRVGAGARSRAERVRAVKAALAGRGEGPRRCC